MCQSFPQSRAAAGPTQRRSDVRGVTEHPCLEFGLYDDGPRPSTDVVSLQSRLKLRLHRLYAVDGAGALI